uniref:Uncharacterized protein n=1 Tax=Oryza punctata TaxID=4537 RepID=A0A0E0MGW1_ORYPU
MTGYTGARGDHRGNTYVFAGDGRELDEIVVRVAGEVEHRFVAAVTRWSCPSWRKLGREPLAFPSARHDSEVKPYCFRNGALVFVKVSWSVMELGS